MATETLEFLTAAATAMAGRDAWRIEILAAGSRLRGDDAEALRELLTACVEALDEAAREEALAEREVFGLENQLDEARAAVRAWIKAGTLPSGPEYERVVDAIELPRRRG